MSSPTAGSFRAERRFVDPAQAPPPEWTAATPPHGVPRLPTGPAASPPDAAPEPSSEAAQVSGSVGAPVDAAQARPAASTPRYLAAGAEDADAAAVPSAGWRRWLYRGTGTLLNVGEGATTAHRRAVASRAERPIAGCYRIAVLSLKGGVGKTTVTATLGATFATARDDRVVAVDANPDRGTLSQKVPLETPATVRHLLRDAEGIEGYGDVRRYTSQGPSRLEVLASETDPAVSVAFSAEDYARTLTILERFYSLVLTDCGTGLMHSAMSSVLARADALIVVSSGSVDGARSASATLDWLDAHGHQVLVREAVAVVNAVRPRSGKVDMAKVVDHFSRRCRAVHIVPFDAHLEEGGEVDLDRLRRSTRDALMELAAAVADGFAAAAPPRG